MKPVTQTKRGGPNAPLEERGDCFDACLASILEVDIGAVHIPHGEDWWDHAHAAVARHGHRLLYLPNPEHATATEIGRWLGDVWWIAAIPSTTLGHHDDGHPVQHVVVMRGPRLAHDPTLGAPRPLGLIPDDVPVFDIMLLLPLAGGPHDFELGDNGDQS